MHIQEGTNTTLTTCTKMTEEVDRRHGVNGNSSAKGVSDEAPVLNSAQATSGGRLKFFKDGKFILELVRGCSREGERPGWVSVPRKTFWPPTAAAQPTRTERAASLSVSDDNSSIQSSPWQRDHCWKQTNPRRNISKELTMYYCRPSTLLTATIAARSRARRRRPLEPEPPERRNGHHSPADDSDDREKYYHMKLKKPHQYHKLRVYTKTRPAVRGGGLSRAVERLRARAAALRAAAAATAATAAPVHAKLASCRQEHALVSPRKRVLRELERVSLEDQGKRRAKTAPALSPRPPPAAPGPSARHVGSYSIHSLLSLDERPEPLGRRAPPPPSAPYGYGYGPFAPLRLPPPAPLYYYALPPPWPPLAHPLLPERHKDEPAPDLPLNLSKH